MKEVAILCADTKSNFHKLKNCEVYDLNNPIQNYMGGLPVVAMPPCAQWSRLRWSAKYNEADLVAAEICVRLWEENGGILEQPSGSTLFEHFGIQVTHSINQSWWGYPATKKTYLAFRGCAPVAHPLSFDAPTRNVCQLGRRQRALMPLELCEWLAESATNWRPRIF